MKFVDRGMYYAMPKALYLISKSNKLHTQGPLTEQYDRKHTLQRSQVQHAMWNAHV